MIDYSATEACTGQDNRSLLCECAKCWGPQIIVIFGYPYTPDNISKYGIVTFLFRYADYFPWCLLPQPVGLM